MIEESVRWVMDNLPPEGQALFMQMVLDLSAEGTVYAVVLDQGMMRGKAVELWVEQEFWGLFWGTRFVTYPDNTWNSRKVACTRKAEQYLRENYKVGTSGSTHHWPAVYYDDHVRKQRE